MKRSTLFLRAVLCLAACNNENGRCRGPDWCPNDELINNSFDTIFFNN